MKHAKFQSVMVFEEEEIIWWLLTHDGYNLIVSVF